jgi:hypothetical protein
MNDADWLSVGSYSDRISAEAFAGLLVGEGVPTRILPDEPIPGLGRNFSVLVPAGLLHRAQWILKQEPVSEKELTDLALGNGRTPP